MKVVAENSLPFSEIHTLVIRVDLPGQTHCI